MHASFEVGCGILRSSCGGWRGWRGRYPGFIFFVIQHIGFGALSQSPPRQSWRRRGRRGRGWLVWLAGWLAAGFQHRGQLPVSSSPALQAGRRRCSTATPTVAVRRRIQTPPPNPSLHTSTGPSAPSPAEDSNRAELQRLCAPLPRLLCFFMFFFFFPRPPFLTTHCDYV